MKRALIAAVALFATVSFSGMVLAADAPKTAEPAATTSAEPTKAEGAKTEKKTEKKAVKKAKKAKKAAKKEEKKSEEKAAAPAPTTAPAPAK